MNLLRGACEDRNGCLAHEDAAVEFPARELYRPLVGGGEGRAGTAQLLLRLVHANKLHTPWDPCVERGQKLLDGVTDLMQRAAGNCEVTGKLNEHRTGFGRHADAGAARASRREERNRCAHEVPVECAVTESSDAHLQNFNRARPDLR
jgi:hypothetical protein